MIFNDNYNPQQLHEAVKSIEDDTIILSFLDKSYIPIFDVFYEEISKFGYDNLLIISLDDESEEHLQDRGVKTAKVKYKVRNRHKLWYERFLFTEYLFTYFRKNILHTDVDCIWYKDIYNKLKDVDLDIMISTAHGYPDHVEEEFGFLGCMGLFLCNYNDRTVDFFKRAREAPVNMGIEYDQVIVNNYIFYTSPVISPCYYDPVHHIVTTDGVAIGFLSEDIVNRKYQDDLYCYHPCRKDESIVAFAEKLRKYSDKP